MAQAKVSKTLSQNQAKCGGNISVIPVTQQVEAGGWQLAWQK
jgi:hypothetical protein